MSQRAYNASQTTFGKRHGGGLAQPRQYAPTRPQTAPQPFQQTPQYAGTTPQAYNQHTSGGGVSVTGRPVKGLRFLSGIIDLCIVSVLCGIVFTFKYGFGVGPTELLSKGLLSFYLWFGTVCFIYGFSMEASPLQGTVGKLATGTVVVAEDGQPMWVGQALGRNLGKMLTYCIPLYIGYLMVLWTKNNQSLHDKMAGTLVYRKGESPQSYAETFA